TPIAPAVQPGERAAIGQAPPPTNRKHAPSRPDKPPTAMYHVRIEIEPARHETLIAELWEAGTLGVVEGDGFVEAFFDDFAAAACFGSPLPAPERDWVQETEDAWPPILVGEKFFVVAPWRTEPTPPGRFR